MKTMLPIALLFFVLLAPFQPTRAQKMKLGEVLVVGTPTLKSDADPKAFEALLTDEVAPAWKARVPGIAFHLLRADRGDRTGEYLSVWVADTRDRRNASLPANDASPFSEAVLRQTGSFSTPLSTYLSSEGPYTDYALIGADKAGDLPSVDILGIHYIQVEADRREAFERFVRDTLHPALAHQIPGMRLLYYKGVRGEQTGSYLTIFAIASVETREQYWPTNAPETETLKAAFKPLEPLARELGTYLVEGSYLEAGTGAAAAYFESLEWTDFVRVPSAHDRHEQEH